MSEMEVKKLKMQIEQKSRFVQGLPYPRKIYSSALEYGKNEKWQFDEQQFNDDTEYSKMIFDSMADYNAESEAFNDILYSVLKFLTK